MMNPSCRLRGVARRLSPALPRTIAFLVTLIGVGAFTGPAAAHECDAPRGPLESCPCDAYDHAVPRRVESTTWVLAGVGPHAGRRPTSAAVLGIGGEATVGPLARYRGFPSSNWGAGEAEVRGGVWAVGATRFDGSARLEGGLKAHLGAINMAEWGTFDLRVGAGYGALDIAPRSYFVTTFAWGVRSFQQRYGRCGGAPHDDPKPHGYGSVMRLFATVRRTANADSNVELTVGVELSPTFFLPPYSWFRLGGGPA